VDRRDPLRNRVAIDAKHRLLARLSSQRRLIGEVGDVFLEPALLNQLDRAAKLLDLLEDGEDALLVGVAERIDDGDSPLITSGGLSLDVGRALGQTFAADGWGRCSKS
jgi:hypothetical protein